jgi:hypothetical protein
MARVLTVLGGALLTMLVVVTLRAESARLHFEMSALDAKAEQLVQDVRDQELELARLRNPARIQARVVELRNRDTDPPAPRGSDARPRSRSTRPPDEER